MKICGITRREDALAAVEQHVWALGFVFWPASPRFIDPEAALAIREAIPASVETVGVFVNQSVDEVNAIADVVRLDAVQLHGDEDAAFAAQMKRPVIKAVSLRRGVVEAGSWPESTLLLVDAHDPIRYGGTGKISDWSSASALAATRRVLLAGGLTAENVGEAIRRVRPFGIDVSSGVESAPGVKDGRKLKALFDAVTAEQ